MRLRSDDTVLNPKFGVDILKTATCRSWQPKALHKIGEKTSDGDEGGGGAGLQKVREPGTGFRDNIGIWETILGRLLKKLEIGRPFCQILNVRVRFYS